LLARTVHGEISTCGDLMHVGRFRRPSNTVTAASSARRIHLYPYAASDSVSSTDHRPCSVIAVIARYPDPRRIQRNELRGGREVLSEGLSILLTGNGDRTREPRRLLAEARSEQREREAAGGGSAVRGRQQKRVKRPADDAAVSPRGSNPPSGTRVAVTPPRRCRFSPRPRDNPRPRPLPSPTHVPRAGTDSLSGSLRAIKSRDGGAKRAPFRVAVRFSSFFLFFSFFFFSFSPRYRYFSGTRAAGTLQRVQKYYDYGDIAEGTRAHARLRTLLQAGGRRERKFARSIRVLSIRSVQRDRTSRFNRCLM